MASIRLIVRRAIWRLMAATMVAGGQ